MTPQSGIIIISCSRRKRVEGREVGGGRETERERERERERGGGADRQRQTQTQTDRLIDRQTSR